MASGTTTVGDLATNATPLTSLFTVVDDGTANTWKSTLADVGNAMFPLVNAAFPNPLWCNATRVVEFGTATNVPADGSASFSVSFTTDFASILQVLCTPWNYSGADNAIVAFQVLSRSTNGFVIMAAGGASRSTVSIDYQAIGT